MVEDNEIEEILKEVKESLYNSSKIKFPCGLEIESNKELFKNVKDISCPLHGKKCENISIRKVEEIHG